MSKGEDIMLYDIWEDAFIVKPVKGSPQESWLGSDIKKAIETDVMESRCPYIDWYIKYLEENEPQKMVGYNKSNHEDPTAQYVALDLFDLFFLYVMAASKKSSDSKLSNMRSGPWNDIKVEEMIEDFNNFKEKNDVPCDLDKHTLIIEIDKTLDKTITNIKNILSTVKWHVFPKWLSFLDKALYDEYVFKQKGGNRTKDIYYHCKEVYDKWASEN